MSLSSGTRVGGFQILSLIGSGGMGEVYRARDTRLNRDVALKVLPEALAADPDRLARFKREAQVLAALNHPHIAAIYGLEQSNGVDALVMELVGGPTLADRIERGPIPIDEALPIARQLAEALDAAHEQGIIHRDLKPENIKLTPDGTVKVLDFGLAKAVEKTGILSELTQSPTVMTPTSTVAGVICGTVAYMSPEQARGKPVDKRADIWAFGCVLFEMLTGHKPFPGTSLPDTVAAILTSEPDWHTLPPGTPASLRTLLARCFRKDPTQRLRDIGDARFQLEDTQNDSLPTEAAVQHARTRRERAIWSAAVLTLGAALVFATRPSTVPTAAGPISFPVFPPENTVFSGAINTTLNVPSFALSPDGRQIVFTAAAPGARPSLWIRSMDRVTAQEVSGTEGAFDPAWDPDGRWIAFFADGKLKKVPAVGGAVQIVSQGGTDNRGATWGAGDTILFGGGIEPIRLVSAAGGTTTPVTVVDASRQESSHRNPFMLPDGQHFLYSIFGSHRAQNGIYVGSLDGKTRRLLVQVETSAVYAPPGYLLFVDGDTLLAQSFDPGRLEVNGQPFLVAEHVGRNTGFMSAVSSSRTGTIAYASTMSQNGRLTWLDRAGRTIGSIDVPESDTVDFRLSPDETRLAASIVDPATNTLGVWLTDLTRGGTSRIAFGGLVNAAPIWSPDGSRLIFRTNRNGAIEFYERSAAGGGEDRLVLPLEAYRTSISSQNLVSTDWSRNGQIVFSAPGPTSGNDLWLLTIAAGEKPVKFIGSDAEELHGNFSPDGRLMAYTSNESGKFQIYVETVPRSDRKWVVSTTGGYEPRWRSDGREIYYLSEDRKLMAVAVGAGPSFGVPTALFQTHVPIGVTANRTHYVPSRDGQRFLVQTATDRTASQITVVVNWTAMLKK